MVSATGHSIWNCKMVHLSVYRSRTHCTSWFGHWYSCSKSCQKTETYCSYDIFSQKCWMGSIQPSWRSCSTLIIAWWGIWISHLVPGCIDKAGPALPLPFTWNTCVTNRRSSRTGVISISFGIWQNGIINVLTRTIYIIGNKFESAVYLCSD